MRRGDLPDSPRSGIRVNAASTMSAPLRIVLTHHDRHAASRSARHVAELAAQLASAGQALVAIEPLEPVCRFASEPGTCPTFDSRGNVELNRLRDRRREALDRQIDGFNPHVVHAQHAWIDAHLALEAGVPYVVTVWDDELHTLTLDTRLRRVVLEGLENAGKIVAATEAVAAQLIVAFPELDASVVTLLAPRVEDVPTPLWLGVYREVLERRYGDALPF